MLNSKTLSVRVYLALMTLGQLVTEIAVWIPGPAFGGIAGNRLGMESQAQIYRMRQQAEQARLKPRFKDEK